MKNTHTNIAHTHVDERGSRFKTFLSFETIAYLFHDRFRSFFRSFILLFLFSSSLYLVVIWSLFSQMHNNNNNNKTTRASWNNLRWWEHSTAHSSSLVQFFVQICLLLLLLCARAQSCFFFVRQSSKKNKSYLEIARFNANRFAYTSTFRCYALCFHSHLERFNFEWALEVITVFPLCSFLLLLLFLL